MACRRARRARTSSSCRTTSRTRTPSTDGRRPARRLHRAPPLRAPPSRASRPTSPRRRSRSSARCRRRLRRSPTSPMAAAGRMAAPACRRDGAARRAPHRRRDRDVRPRLRRALGVAVLDTRHRPRQPGPRRAPAARTASSPARRPRTTTATARTSAGIIGARNGGTGVVGVAPGDAASTRSRSSARTAAARCRSSCAASTGSPPTPPRSGSRSPT